MNQYDPRARIGYRGTSVSRAKDLALKAGVVLGGAVMLVSAFAISMVVLAISLAAVVTVGGYLWWKTRELRKQLRERMQVPSKPTGRVIEGEAITVESSRR